LWQRPHSKIIQINKSTPQGNNLRYREKKKSYEDAGKQ
jgi:hypothetical protein